MAMTTRRPKVRAYGCLLVMCAAISSGCVPRPYRLRYMSFEKVDKIVVESRTRLGVENLMLGSSVPVDYVLKRERYQVRIRIDRKSYAPVAMIELQDAQNLRIAVRPEIGARPGRGRPCASFDEFPGRPEKFMFSWVICGDDAGAQEFIVAFDVVDGKGAVVAEERLPFELKRDGVYWATDSL